MMNAELTVLRSIDGLPGFFQQVVDAVQHTTGHAVVILWGGPQVKENGNIGTWRYMHF